MNGGWIVPIQGLFVLLSVLTIADYVRRPDQARFDILLMFLVVAIAIVVPAVEKLFGFKNTVIERLATAILLAHPYLILRLASYSRSVHASLRYSLLGAYVLSVGLVIALTPLPTSATAFIAAYFLTGEVAAGSLFFRGAMNSGGVTRWRLALASSGSVLLGILIGLAGVAALAGLPKSALQGITLILAGLVALSYYFGFASPRWLQRIWQTQELVRLIGAIGELPATTQIERVGEYLGRAVHRVVANSVAAGVGLALADEREEFAVELVGSKEASDAIRRLVGAGDRIVQTVLESKVPAVAETVDEIGGDAAKVALELGAKSAYCVPISTRSHLWGILLVFVRRTSLFPRDDLNLLKTMTRYVSQVVDLRELVESERDLSEKLRKASLEAEAANRAKSDFLANMSHELRTPLNSIIGFSEILAERSFGELNEKQQRYIDNILTSGRHLLQLINDILDLSKIEAGRMTMQLEEVDPIDTIREVLEIVGSMASKKEIEFVVDVPSSMPSISADRAKLRQVLYNLLSNAIKFTLPKGSVTVHALQGPEKRSDRQSQQILEIQVIDTGIGIRSSDLDRVFGKFEQVDSSYARKQQGTGLGLALTKRLVEMHGGRITVESEGVGKGSTFTVKIPVVGPVVQIESPPVVGERQEPRLKASRKSGPRVLVIEDDPHASELLTYHLEEAGFQVECMADGNQAIEAARKEPPNAITLDILLPKSDGWEVLKQLRSLDETKNIPVIVVSVTQDRDLGLSLGASEFLVKPIVGKELIDTVGAVIQSSTEGTKATS